MYWRLEGVSARPHSKQKRLENLIVWSLATGLAGLGQVIWCWCNFMTEKINILNCILVSGKWTVWQYSRVLLLPSVKVRAVTSSRSPSSPSSHLVKGPQCPAQSDSDGASSERRRERGEQRGPPAGLLTWEFQPGWDYSDWLPPQSRSYITVAMAESSAGHWTQQNTSPTASFWVNMTLKKSYLWLHISASNIWGFCNKIVARC